MLKVPQVYYSFYDNFIIYLSVDFRKMVVEQTLNNSDMGKELDWEKLLPVNTSKEIFTFLSATDVRTLKEMHPNVIFLIPS
jgi:hypothetical protein